MRSKLFRDEALEFNRERTLGDAVQVRPMSLTLLTLFFAVLAAMVVLFAIHGEYTRKAHVRGYLAPDKGLIKIFAPQAGTLIEKHVQEGQLVEQGAPLFVLSTESSSPDSAQTQASAIEKLRERRRSLSMELGNQAVIDGIQTQAARARLRSLESEQAQVAAELRIQHQRISSAQESVQRYQRLQQEKFISPAQAQQKQEELLEQQARLQTLMRSRTALERDIGAVRHELASVDLRTTNQRSVLERDMAGLDQQLTEHEARRTIVITAPARGTVTAILAQQGQHAQAQSPLLSILPAGARLEAQLLVPSRAIGFIAPQQTVALRYQAFPYQRFGSQHGRIIEISKSLIVPGETQLPVTLEEPAYRVTVALDMQTLRAYNRDMALQPGMLLDADVWLDRRTIMQWVFDPLYSVARRV